MDQLALDVWQASLTSLARDISPIGYDIWVNQLRPHKVEGGVFMLLAPDSTVKTTIEHRYLQKIKNTISAVSGKSYDVKIILSDDLSGERRPVLDELPRSSFISNLRTKYIFETFVKGKSNELAFAASMAVAESPGQTTYNPLFLYGGVGLGKTHLMHSIGNHILLIDPYMKVFYTSSESLTNDFVTSIRENKMPKFREKYRNVDVLLVDDIQFLSDKEGTQEEFFHTFNALYFANKQIVISSDKPPSELKTLEERLSSRFGSGLVVDITPPDYETRMAILEKKVEAEQAHVPHEVLRHLAKSITSNIRELEGALNKVNALSKLTKVNITLELAEEAIRGMINENGKREIDIPFIQEIVADYYSISVDEIRSKKRTASLSHARHVAMYITRKMIDVNLTSIGQFYGGRDHSTVCHAIDKITEELEVNPEFENTIVELERRVRGG